MDLALERLAAGGGGERGAQQGQPGQAGQQQVETVLGIFDLRGFTSANADWGFVRFLVDIFFLYYPKVSRQAGTGGGLVWGWCLGGWWVGGRARWAGGRVGWGVCLVWMRRWKGLGLTALAAPVLRCLQRLSQVLFVDAPWVFKPGWEIVRPVSQRRPAGLPAAHASASRPSPQRCCLHSGCCHARPLRPYSSPLAAHFASSHRPPLPAAPHCPLRLPARPPARAAVAEEVCGAGSVCER